MAIPELIPTVPAADVLGVDRSTLTRWVKQGRIKPALTVPGYRGHFLFDAEDIHRLADQLESRKAS